MILSSDRRIRVQSGFTLIEMMIVVVIIGLLAAIAIPSYQVYANKAHANACLSEAKSYGKEVFVLLNDEDSASTPSSPILSSCQSITDATGWTLHTWQKIEAIAKAPSHGSIECDIPNGTPCIILP